MKAKQTINLWQHDFRCCNIIPSVGVAFINTTNQVLFKLSRSSLWIVPTEEGRALIITNKWEDLEALLRN